jgi:hypothetical protein
VLDQLQWCWSANGVYSSRSAYAVLLSEQAAVPLTNVGSFVASAPAEMLDRDHRCHRELQVDNSCALCSQEPELIDHLMVRCLFSRGKCGSWPCGMADGSPWRLPRKAPLLPGGWKAESMSSRREGMCSDSLMIGVAWAIWLQRNERCFTRSCNPPASVALEA